MSSPTLPDAQTLETALRLHSACIRILRLLRKVDPKTRLDAAPLSALSVLVFGGPCTLGELATAEQKKPPSITRIVAELESRSLVRRRTDDNDRRVVRIEATAKGTKLMLEGRDRRAQLLAQWIGRLTAAQRQAIYAALPALEAATGEAQSS